ncbi:unnamed protein product [Ilex paraguariensis]|uniref:PGG domain-containing protein n=1 Tax=Ilex paraguariensis TaxID=185542 RepID=A0ABC8V3V4_9AQUA
MAPAMSKLAVNDSTGFELSHRDHSNRWQERSPTEFLSACENDVVEFVRQAIQKRPELARYTDSNGYSGLHFACANGSIEVVKELVKHDPQLCLLWDEHGRIPLQIAAIFGNIEVLKLLVKDCPESITLESVAWVTLFRETTFHLALKNDQWDFFEALITEIEKRKLDQEDLLNLKDNNGDTVLHIASDKGQTQIISLLLKNNARKGPLVQVDFKNKKGFTASDLYCQTSSGRYILQLFHEAAAQQKVPLQSQSPPPKSTIMDGLMPASMSLQAMSVLVTVFIFFAGAAYQVLSSYGNVYPLHQLAKNGTISFIGMLSDPDLIPDGFYFILFNTVAFVLSMVVILLAIWLLDSPWSFIVRGVMLVLVSTISFAYAIMVKRVVPHFLVSIIGSFKVSSFLAVWLFDLGLMILLFVVGLIVKKIVSNTQP